MISNNFFTKIYMKIKPYLLDSTKIYFSALNSEKCITENKRRYYYDFTLIDRVNNNKKIIEFNGDFFHCNPKIYNENFINPCNKICAKKIWEQDEIKIAAAKHFNYDVKFVWESDMIENETKMINECVSFLIGE